MGRKGRSAGAAAQPARGAADQGGAGCGVRPRAAAVPSPIEALAKLRDLTEVLANTAQGQGSQFQGAVRAAASSANLHHRDHGVRLWAAKCLAEALRVFAPSPPLDAAGLRGALDLFVEQLGVLKDPGSASFVQAYGLLERLAQTNAFALLFDCADPDGLLCAVVAACVEAARVNEAGRLDGLLGQVLAGVLDGSDGLPAAALSSLLLELSPQRSGSLARGLVCRTLRSLELRSASLSINDLVSSMLLQGRTSSEEVGSIGTAPDELEAVMGIVHELFAISPTLVTKALPNLRDDLRSPERLRRLLATRCVGRMLSQFHVSGASVVERPLCETYPLLLDSHLDRLDDADEEVRLAALEGAGAIISAACSLGASVVFNAEVSRGGGAAVAKAAESYREAVVGHYLDPSDTVRFRLIQIARDIALASEAGYEFLAPVLPNIFGRILDKRADIREESADAAARLYGKYAVPALTTCQYKVAERLAWVPQLICEAFSVFAGGRLGHTARLEEHIEQHLLGSSAGLEAPKRALTLAGFYCFASRHSTSRKGLMTLLSRKREAHAALRQFLRLRAAKAAPLLEFSAPAGGGAEVAPSDAEAVAALDNLGRLSPCLEDRAARPDTLLAKLRSWDAVRDPALWEQLGRLGCEGADETTDAVESRLEELERLLRVHRLMDIAPLLRRALLCTWLLPDQATALIQWWSKVANPLNGECKIATGDLISGLTKCFPHAFAPCAEELAAHLHHSSDDLMRDAVRALGALGKRAESMVLSLSRMPAQDEFTQALLAAIGRMAGRTTDCSGACKHALYAIELLPPSEKHLALQHLMKSLGVKHTLKFDDVRLATAFHLTAACSFWLQDRPESSVYASRGLDSDRWLGAARAALDRGARAAPEVRHAAAEVCVALGTEEDVVEMLAGAADVDASLPLHAAVGVLRAIRKGSLPLTTRLLLHIASRFSGALMLQLPPAEVDVLVVSLQKLQKPSNGRARLADRLRLCGTLPALFAHSANKQHKNTVQSILQASLLKAGRHAVVRQEPLLDFLIGCFLHFLSRLNCFRAEAAAAKSAFPESTKIALFFCEALFRSDPARRQELGAMALQVCDRLRAFVDREQPSSDAVHRASYVLRYVVEKSCPELGGQARVAPQDAARRSMPAELFAIRGGAADVGPALLEAPLPPPAAVAAAGAGGRLALDCSATPVHEAAPAHASRTPAAASTAAAKRPCAAEQEAGAVRRRLFP